jgi:hypothetical protein
MAAANTLGEQVSSERPMRRRYRILYENVMGMDVGRVALVQPTFQTKIQLA